MNNKEEIELDKDLTEFLQDRKLLEFLQVLDHVKEKKSQDFGPSCLLMAALLLLLVALTGYWIFQNPIQGRYPLIINGITELSDACSRDLKNIDIVIHNSPGFFIPSPGENPPSEKTTVNNFRPLTYLEGMVGVAVRSDHFCLLSPEFSVALTPGDSLQFTWKEPGTSSLCFTVLNNRGEMMVSRENITGASFTLITNSWKEGVYYWKIIEKDMLLNVGKITLRK
ncbi:MAG: hypothetical protein IH596_10670 [Bacteroidales bacterium]|nr:hypothetical protein [Bacteroidales bacterium]